MHSNLITPPDFVDEPMLSVLIVEPTPIEVENIAYWCRTADRSWNIYIYMNDMNNQDWLEQAIERADYLLVNNADSPLSLVKNILLKNTRSWHWGPKDIIGNDRKINDPLEFFVGNYV
jgi:hypothetical protein